MLRWTLHILVASTVHAAPACPGAVHSEAAGTERLDDLTNEAATGQCREGTPELPEDAEQEVGLLEMSLLQRRLATGKEGWERFTLPATGADGVDASVGPGEEQPRAADDKQRSEALFDVQDEILDASAALSGSNASMFESIEDALGAAGSCREFGCDDQYKAWNPCQCNSKCEHYRNCCYDFHATCHTIDSHAGEFKCETTLDFGEVVNGKAKGIALDDTTLEHCADQIPITWPNTQAKVTSMRLFKPWGMTPPKYFHADMNKAWDGLKAYAKATGAKFLLGVSVTCRPELDEKEWQAGQRFIRHVGAEHIMGLAVGNEIDLQIGDYNKGCADWLWYNGGYISTLEKRVREFDAIPGMKDLPITAVFSNQCMGGWPFTWKVTNFLKSALEKLGSRFAFSINLYPQFSGGLKQAGCHQSAVVGTKFDMSEPAGWTPNVVKSLRERMANLGAADRKLWIGETGWATKAYCVLSCHEACRSQSTQRQYYEHFLKWDLTAGQYRADHVFYFTLRDSSVFGESEEFGLITKCGEKRCKFQP